jgi:riboflavin synthase
MFSGIIETMATAVAIEKDQENVNFTLSSPIAPQLKPAESLAHNGVCLTVVTVDGNTYTTTAMRETLQKTNLGDLRVGDKVNLERPLAVNARLDGHIVQGHVDQTAICTNVEDAQGSYIYTFRYPFDREMARKGYFCVDKGSVTVNGVSLTVCNPTDDTFQVNIIPFTYEHTNFHAIQTGTKVNLEFDILGKLIARLHHFEE